MLTDFQNSFTGRLSSRPKFATKSYFNISAHLKYVATLPYEIQKNGRAPEGTEAHCHVRLSHSKISGKIFAW